jgi:hypothetical protein
VISAGDINMTVATSALFANNGTLNISLASATNTARFSAYLSHRGQLNVLQGNLVLLGGSDAWAPITISSQASINFAGATTNINIGTTLVSSGNMYYTGGSIYYQYV